MYKFLAGLIIGVLGTTLVVWAPHAFSGMSQKEASPATTQDEQQMTQEEPLPADSIVGQWQSTDDPKFTRTIYENGGYTDAYADAPDATSNGPWVTFTKADAPADFPYPLADNTTYLQLDSGKDALYFSIATKTPETLSLIYLNRGGVLNFTRVIGQ